MEIRVREKQKYVEIWLSRAESVDTALRGRLAPLCQQYRAQKYLVALYLSGSEPLYGETLELLRRNRRRQARLADAGEDPLAPLGA